MMGCEVDGSHCRRAAGEKLDIVDLTLNSCERKTRCTLETFICSMIPNES